MSLDTPAPRSPTRVVLVPGVLALLPEYGGLSDPVLDLRLACLDAVTWLADGGAEVVVLGDGQGRRVGEALLSAAGVSTRLPAHPAPPPNVAYLVVGNGSACRSEKAPGHLDERSFAFDDGLRAALVSGDVGWTDDGAEGLLASLDGIRELFRLLPAGTGATVDYDDDPYGVQYWVLRWDIRPK